MLRQWKQSLHLFTEMQRTKHRPDKVTYGALVAWRNVPSWILRWIVVKLTRVEVSRLVAALAAPFVFYQRLVHTCEPNEENDCMRIDCCALLLRLKLIFCMVATPRACSRE